MAQKIGPPFGGTARKRGRALEKKNAGKPE
jgi:hypothetical protein